MALETTELALELGSLWIQLTAFPAVTKGIPMLGTLVLQDHVFNIVLD